MAQACESPGIDRTLLRVYSGSNKDEYIWHLFDKLDDLRPLLK